jgi:uncharacterized membrane protein YfcA
MTQSISRRKACVRQFVANNKDALALRFVAFVLALCLAEPAFAAQGAAIPWWAWPALLFAASLAIGAFGVLAGVGGGVLFVPIVGGFFPFHLDFVRAAGLLLALCGALSAAPRLLSSGMANLRLAMPLALAGSITSIVGALIGLALPTHVAQTALGATILAIAVLMLRAGRSEFPQVLAPDRVGAALRLAGVFSDPASGRSVEWRTHRTLPGVFLFGAIGLLAGMFGLGAGWANVPALNLVMGVPLKLAVGTSGLILSVVDTSAAWVYIHRGAVLPVLVVPSVAGVMLGAKVGARLLRVAPARTVRKIVIALLLLAGARALLKGLGIWN